MEKSNFLQPNQATTTLGIPNTPSHSKKKEGIASIFEEALQASRCNRRPSVRDSCIPNDDLSPDSFIKIEAGQQQRERQKLLNSRIRINVSGDRYETYRTTLDIYPNTLLGDEKKRRYYYDNNRKEYFFDRHRGCFGAILYYYQSNGRLRRPGYIPLDVFLEEVLFFQLGPEAFHQIKDDENIEVITKTRLPKTPIRRYLWATTEYPNYSKIAKSVHIISLLLVTLLAIVIAIETLPQYSHSYCKTEHVIFNYSYNATNQSSGIESGVCHSYFTSPFFLIQTICIVFFTIEFVIRIFSTPSILAFIKNLTNWTDFIAIVSYYVTLDLYLDEPSNEINTDQYAGLRLLRVIRLLQVLKVCRIFKSVKSLRVFLTTMSHSLIDFAVMIAIITCVGFLFGTAVYYSEVSINGMAFDSVLTATYWGIITITAVGYGDIVPKTVAGRIITCFCALFSAAIMGMLTSVLVGRYQRDYVHTVYIDEISLSYYEHPSDGNDNDDDNNSNGRGDMYLRTLAPSTENHENPNIENVEERKDENAINRSKTSLEVPIIHDSRYTNETSITSMNNRTCSIIGYIKDGKGEISQDLLEKIKTIIAKKQTPGIHITLSIENANSNRNRSTHDVRFELDEPSDEEFAAEDNHDQNLAKTVQDDRSLESSLKTFVHSTL